MSRRPVIREGDAFRSGSGEVWTVTEDLRFGQGYWVVSADRCRQTILPRSSLEKMTPLAAKAR